MPKTLSMVLASRGSVNSTLLIADMLEDAWNIAQKLDLHHVVLIVDTSSRKSELDMPVPSALTIRVYARGEAIADLPSEERWSRSGGQGRGASPWNKV